MGFDPRGAHLANLIERHCPSVKSARMLAKLPEPFGGTLRQSIDNIGRRLDMKASRERLRVDRASFECHGVSLLNLDMVDHPSGRGSRLPSVLRIVISLGT